MTNSRRVVVTGLGVVAAPGANVEEFWSSVSSGRPAVAPMESVDRTQLRFQHVAEVKNFDPRRHFEEKQLDLLDRFSMFGLVAADAPGVPDILKGGEVSGGGDVAAFASALGRLLDDEELRRQLGARVCASSKGFRRRRSGRVCATSFCGRETKARVLLRRTGQGREPGKGEESSAG